MRDNIMPEIQPFIHEYITFESGAGGMHIMTQREQIFA